MVIIPLAVWGDVLAAISAVLAAAVSVLALAAISVDLIHTAVLYRRGGFALLTSGFATTVALLMTITTSFMAATIMAATIMTTTIVTTPIMATTIVATTIITTLITPAFVATATAMLITGPTAITTLLFHSIAVRFHSIALTNILQWFTSTISLK